VPYDQELAGQFAFFAENALPVLAIELIAPASKVRPKRWLMICPKLENGNATLRLILLKRNFLSAKGIG